MNHPIRLLLAFCVLLLAAPIASADAADDLKARMSERLPSVVALLKRGAVGENNAGTLTERGSLSEAEKALVKAENTDRVAVYTLIARKTNTTPASVGQQRAKQIRSASPSGTWVQKADGTWEKA
ncbi:MAG: DUF1318 domain-containing protein [Verrucomicrobia bacterium]|jgi:uncharacterized protein|nr:DUF1318 domain-containing protein [Verrucomicrobiota bacterium]MDA1006349.1 DUF1318 domain-containing protein [Verrucomicrobiota bacterium]